MANRMSYRSAQVLGRKSWSDLITSNLADPNSTILGSFGGAVSDKTRAAATRLKEKFDPLNIARAVGGSFGSSLLGKMTGRSQEDIRYFGNKGKPGFQKQLDRESKESPLYTKIGEGQVTKVNKGEGLANVLAKIYNIIKKNIADDTKRRELDADRAEEKEKKKEEWHKQLIKALLGVQGVKTVTQIKEKEKGGFGIGDIVGKIQEMVNSLIEKALGGFRELIDFIKDLKNIFSDVELFRKLAKYIGPILRFFTGPVGLAILGLGAAYALSLWLQKMIKYVPDYSKITPDEAASYLENASRHDIQSRKGGKRALIDVVVNGVKRAQEILDRGDEVEIASAGGRAMLEKTIEQGNIVLPGKTSYGESISADELNQPEPIEFTRVEPKPVINTKDPNNLKARAAWERKYGAKYDENGILKGATSFRTARPATPAPPAPGPSATPAPTATPAAPAPSPMTQQMQGATEENLNANIAPKSKVVSLNNSQTKVLPGTNPTMMIDGTISLRTDDRIINKILTNRVYRPV